MLPIPSRFKDFAAAAIADFPSLNLLFNNAGVALLGQFDEFDQTQMAWLMDINFWGVVRGTRAFLGHLQSRPQAHIVNISSIFGIIAPAGQSAYAASKFAVRGFSEALRHELAMNKSTVRLSVVHPGGVKTNIARKARTGNQIRESVSMNEVGDRFERMARTTPTAAAQRIIRGIERNEPRILIGGDAKLLDIIQRLRPATYWAAFVAYFRPDDRLEEAASSQGSCNSVSSSFAPYTFSSASRMIAGCTAMARLFSGSNQ